MNEQHSANHFGLDWDGEIVKMYCENLLKIQIKHTSVKDFPSETEI